MKGILCQAEMVRPYPQDNGEPLEVFRKTDVLERLLWQKGGRLPFKITTSQHSYSLFYFFAIELTNIMYFT